jgi:quinol monooxygenase YgiN
MTTMICVEATLQAGRVQDATEFLQQRFPETREYAGCQDIIAYLNDDGKTMMFVEHWDSKADFDKYLAWRQESGSFAAFTDMVDGELKFRTFEQVDA